MFIFSTDMFRNIDVCVTEKMDGENTTIYRDYSHARSLSSSGGELRSVIKQLQANIGYRIPNGWRICGENLFSKHSIFYNKLPAYFLVFSVWNEQNICLSWDDTVRFCKEIGLHTVPVLFRGEYDERLIRRLYSGTSCCGGKQEGYVLRNSETFPYEAFSMNVSKFVRKNHVQTDKHWKQEKIVQNAVV